MSPSSVELLTSRTAWAPPEAQPLDEAVWLAWVAKGRAHDRRSNTTYVKVAKCLSIVALVAAAALWSQLASFDIVVRFTVTAGAIIVMLQALQDRQYALTAVFGGLAVVYNPLAPVLYLSGDWQRAAVVVSTVPFMASLAWPNAPADQGARA